MMYATRFFSTSSDSVLRGAFTMRVLLTASHGSQTICEKDQSDKRLSQLVRLSVLLQGVCTYRIPCVTLTAIRSFITCVHAGEQHKITSANAILK